MNGLFFLMYVPVCIALTLIGWMAYKAGEKAEAVLQRIEAIDLVDDAQFTGTIAWPVEPDEWLLDGLRSEAGDSDDLKRQYLESAIRLTEVKH